MRIVILCGGSGSRLWPESRENLPKQFIPIFNGKSLLDLTIERVLSINSDSKPIFISNKRHGFLVKKALLEYNLDANIILEPEGRNTCAAIYLAAKICSPNDNLLIMPSDHLIPDGKKFIKDISNIEKYLTFNHWVVLGIKPTKPSEAYGYIKVSKHNNDNDLLKVTCFVEKPTKEIAADFINDNSYFWNAGIFLGKSSMIISSIKEHAANIALHCDNAFDSKKISRKMNEVSFSPDLFSKIPSQSIDYSVMEHEKKIYLYPMNGGWSDVGSWDAIAEIYKNENKSKNIIEIDSKNNFIRSEKRVIATIGIKDLIIINGDNSTLIAKKNHSEKVKLVVNELIEKDFSEATEHSFEIRPWGKFKNLLDDQNCKVKRIEVKPKKRLSLQYHKLRSEHWLIVKGTATIYLDGKILKLSIGMSIDIPKKSKHYIHNETNEYLIIIETQLGTYFGEDDIIRLDDPYER